MKVQFNVDGSPRSTEVEQKGKPFTCDGNKFCRFKGGLAIWNKTFLGRPAHWEVYAFTCPLLAVSLDADHYCSNAPNVPFITGEIK